MNTKPCLSCKIEKFLSEFSKNKAKPSGLQDSCKVCCSRRHREYYKKNKEWMIKSITESKEERTNQNQRRCFEYLLCHPCVTCGETDPRILEFDHLQDKKHNVSEMFGQGYSWVSIFEEIQKCQVLCVSCHTLKTHASNNSYKHRLFLEKRAQFAEALAEHMKRNKGS